jgi:hypothetical protein
MPERSAHKTVHHVCFPLLVDGLQLSMPEEFRLNESAVEAVIENSQKRESLHNNLLSGFTTRGLEVMSRFVPTLMCGEESAAHVFHKEAKRIEDIRAAEASSSLLAQIAAEEVLHERLLDLLRNCLPVPGDLDALRRRARFFFFRLASRDPATHFARIIGLDGGVCITLSSLLQPSCTLARAPYAYKIWDRIWRDEARHVRISRQHVLDLGIDQAKLNEEGLRARKGLVELLRPLADDFEDMNIDPDRLFRRIGGGEEV